MPLRLMFDSNKMGVGSVLSLSKDLEMRKLKVDLVQTFSITWCTLIGKATLVLL